MHKEFCLEVPYGVDQHIQGSNEAHLRGDITGHHASVASRTLILDGGRLARAILNLVLWLSGLVKLNPLGIADKKPDHQELPATWPWWCRIVLQH
jgi:hypothetical protein